LEPSRKAKTMNDPLSLQKTTKHLIGMINKPEPGEQDMIQSTIKTTITYKK
jgi:hypothetical protein